MNKALSKLLDIVLVEHINARQIVRRSLAVYGVAAALAVVRIQRLSSRNKIALLQALLKNATSLVVLLNGFPFARKVLRNKFLSLNAVLLAASRLELPAWVSGYVLVESVCDWARGLPFVSRLLRELDDSTWNLSRQALLSLAVPLLLRSDNARIKSILFKRKSPFRDFLALYALWNTVSLYQFLKSSLYKKQGQQKPRNVDSSRSQEAQHVFSSSLLKDKFREINEMTTSRGMWDKVLSCCVGENLTVAAKWTVWRQLLWALLNENKRACSNLQTSFLLMLGFYVLDSNGGQMYVRPGILRYLIRILLTGRLKKNEKQQKAALWAGINLSLKNKNLGH